MIIKNIKNSHKQLYKKNIGYVRNIKATRNFRNGKSNTGMKEN